MRCLLPMLVCLAMIIVISATPLRTVRDAEEAASGQESAAAEPAAAEEAAAPAGGDAEAAAPPATDAAGGEAAAEPAGASGTETAEKPAETPAATETGEEKPAAETVAETATETPAADAPAEPAEPKAAEEPATPVAPPPAPAPEPSVPAGITETPSGDNETPEPAGDGGAAANSMIASDVEIVARTICKPGCGIGPKIFQAKAYLISNMIREHNTVPFVDFNVRKLLMNRFAMWKKVRLEGKNIFTSTHAITRPSFPMCQELATRVLQRSLNFADPTNSATHFKLWAQDIEDSHPEGVKIAKCYFF